MRYFLFIGTVPMRYFLFISTVPMNNLFLNIIIKPTSKAMVNKGENIVIHTNTHVRDVVTASKSKMT